MQIVMIPQDTVVQIQDAARIEEVVGDFVTLKRRGASLVACCPFHNEKTPSFYVTPAKGIFKCFGCGKSGSAVGFVMEHEHCTYVEALRYLAGKYHIQIVEKEETAEEIAQKQRTESLYLVSEFAQKFFVSQLETAEGRAYAVAYYRQRGVEPEWMEKFGLGWAPKSRTALVDAALLAGYKEEYLIAAGLAVKKEDGRLLDKFFERVTFPIYSLSGRVIAFSCRTLSSESNIAKYMNSPETEIYIKSRSLFGIWQAKSDISRLGRCILVEGNLDVVSMHQAGMKNVVASCGTSLTAEQVKLIGRFTENVTVLYDGDKAGIHAAVRAVSLIVEAGLNVKLVLLPDGDDPDSYCRKHTPEEVDDYLRSHEQDFISYMTEQELGDSTDPNRKAEVITEIAEVIGLIADPVKRSVFVGELARRFALQEDVILEKIGLARRRRSEERARQEEREQRRVQAGLDPVAPYERESGVALPVQPVMTLESLESNKIVAKAEEDLLYFMLGYGTEPLVFETDSEYYVEGEQTTVADFIACSLEQDGARFLNEPLAAVYDAYLQAYDEGLGKDGIVKRLLDSPDRVVAFLTTQLSMEKYELTVKSFSDSLTSTDSWLASFVPNTIMVYMERRVENELCKLKARLADDPESQQETMKQMMKLLAVQKGLKSRLGREKKK